MPARIPDQPPHPSAPIASPAFFAQPAIELAPQLLGLIMTRRINGILRRARLVEVEAYLGPPDLASHASKGLTKRTKTLFGPPGHAYVYFIYGLHQMLNIVTGPPNAGQAILLRAAEPLDDWTADLAGPARLAHHFNITPADNGLDLSAGDINFIPDPAHRPRILKSKRIGIDYARHWKNRLLRFIDVNNPVSTRLRF